MVSNIYSNSYLPYVKKYNIDPNKKSLSTSNGSIDPNASKRNNEIPESNNSNSINKLITSDKQDINVSDIIKDFKSTMTAIGVPKSIGNSIMIKVKSAHAEASKANPSISEIQSNLCKAAEELDGYISEALGKPSDVVKQWVDALLLQKINYNAYDPIKTEPVTSASQLNNTTITNIKPSITGISRSNSTTPRITDETSNISTTFEINSSETTTKNNLNKVNLPPQKANSDTTLLDYQIASPSRPAQPQDTQVKDLSHAQLSKKQLNKTRKEFFVARKAFLEKDYKSALSVYPKALENAKLVNDKNVIAQSYSDMGEIYDLQDNVPKALEYYNEALKVGSKTQNTKLLAKVHYNVGSIYDEYNKLPQAIKHYHASLSYDGEIDNPKGQALTLNNIGTIYTSINDLNNAMAHYNEAYSIASQVKDDEALANILSNIGTVHSKQNNNMKALQSFGKALQIDRNLKNKEGYTKTLFEIGKCYEDIGQSILAKQCYSRVLDNSTSLNNQHLLSLATKQLNNLN